MAANARLAFIAVAAAASTAAMLLNPDLDVRYLLAVLFLFLLGVLTMPFSPASPPLPLLPTPAAPPPSSSSKFSISLIDIREHKGHVEYLVRGQYQGFVWTSWKRYSQLRKLKPYLCGASSVAFPGKTPVKTYLAGSEFDLRFLDARRNALNVLFTKHFTQDVFENGITDLVREEALGVPVDSIQIDRRQVRLSVHDVLKDALLALDIAADCVSIASASSATSSGWRKYGQNAQGTVAGFIKDDAEGGLIKMIGRGRLSSTSSTTTAANVLSFLQDASRRCEWDEGFKFEQLLETIEIPQNAAAVHKGFRLTKLAVYRTGTQSPAKMFVAERDSVCLAVTAVRLADGALFSCYRSMQHSQAPPAEGYVRAQVECAGFVVEEEQQEGGGVVLTSVGMIDPVGQIPQWVINLALKNNPWQPWTLLNQM